MAKNEKEIAVKEAKKAEDAKSLMEETIQQAKNAMVAMKEEVKTEKQNIKF